MTIPPLAIVQARIGSTRLPGKMLLPLGGKPLVWHAWNAAVQAFGPEHVVCAIPASADNDELVSVLEVECGAHVMRYDGPECDVLGRFFHVAHCYRWHPDSVIVRVTPDDPWKEPELMRRVARGERWIPVEKGGEAFTLQMLDEAHAREQGAHHREHITHALFPVILPAAPGHWTIDTPEDYERAVAEWDT